MYSHSDRDVDPDGDEVPDGHDRQDKDVGPESTLYVPAVQE